MLQVSDPVGGFAQSVLQVHCMPKKVITIMVVKVLEDNVNKKSCKVTLHLVHNQPIHPELMQLQVMQEHQYIPAPSDGVLVNWLNFPYDSLVLICTSG